MEYSVLSDLEAKIWSKKILLKLVKGANFENLSIIARNPECKYQIFEVLVAETLASADPEFNWEVTCIRGDGGIDFKGERPRKEIQNLLSLSRLLIIGQVKRRSREIKESEINDDLLKIYSSIQNEKNATLWAIIYVLSTSNFKGAIKCFNKVSSAPYIKDLFRDTVIVPLDALNLAKIWALRQKNVLMILKGQLDNQDLIYLKTYLNEISKSAAEIIDIHIKGSEEGLTGIPLIKHLYIGLKVSFSQIKLRIKWEKDRIEKNLIQVSRPSELPKDRGIEILLGGQTNFSAFKAEIHLRCFSVGKMSLGTIIISDENNQELKRMNLGSAAFNFHFHPPYFSIPNLNLEKEAKRLVNKVKAKDIIAMAITGVGGAGKSRLCEELVDYASNNGFHSLSLGHPNSVTSPRDLIREIIFHLGNLDGGPGYSIYFWSTGESTQIITVSNPGTYTVTVTNASGCTGTASINVAQSFDPVPIIVGPLPVCAGDPATLDAGAWNSFLWSTGETSQTISTTTAGMYSVTVTNSDGCVGSDDFTLIVYPKPNAVITGPTHTCENYPVILDAGIGYSSYLWSTGETTQTIVPNMSTTYSVTVENAFGCVNSTSINFTINTNPVFAITGTFVVCQGSSAYLDAGVANSYLWSTGETTQAINPFIEGIYSVTITDVHGCIGTATVAVDVDSIVVAISTIDSILCDGESTTLLASGNSVTWSPAIGLNTTIGTMVVANPSITTTYVVSSTSASGCPSTDSIQIIVNPLPIINVISSNNVPCSGTNTQLSATGADIYSWQPTTFLTDSIGPSVFSIPNDTITYYITGIDSTSGCIGYDSIKLFVLPLPIVSAGHDTILCDATPLLNLYSLGANCAGIFHGLGVDSIFNTFNPSTGPGTYSIWFTHTDPFTGCTNNDTLTISVYASMWTFTQNDTSICEGTLPILLAQGNNPMEGYFTGDGIYPTYSGFYFDPNVVTPGSTSVITYHPYDPCYYDSHFSITVNPLPIPILSPDDTICIGETIQLTALGGTIYDWSPQQGLDNSSSSSVNASPTISTTYYIEVSDSNGCTAIGSTSIVVLQMPEPPIIISPIISDCEPLTLQIILSDPETFSFIDYGDGSTGDELIHTYTDTGSFILTLFYSNGRCVYSLPEDTLSVYPSPSAVIEVEPLQTEDGCTFAIKLKATDLENVDNWLWLFPDLPVDTSRNPIITRDDLSDYEVKLLVSNKFGCTDTFSTKITTTSPCHSLFIPNAFTPNGDGLNDNFDIIAQNLSQYFMQIFNRWGQTIYATENLYLPWDGTYHGEKSEIGTYVYEVHVTFTDGVSIFRKGNVTLLR